MNAKRIDPIERLAMRMCWLMFSPPRTKKALGHTERTYWASLPDWRRDDYKAEARVFLYLHRELHETDSSIDVLENALEHQEEMRA